MFIETLSMPLRKALAANSTYSSYATYTPVATEPTGVIEVAGKDGNVARNKLLIIPYGIGSDNTTFSLRILGWENFGNLWIPTNLGEIACTIDAVNTGDGKDLLTTECFCDTITLTKGATANLLQQESIISPADSTIASFFVELRGTKKVQLQFKTGSSATSCNALVKMF